MKKLYKGLRKRLHKHTMTYDDSFYIKGRTNINKGQQLWVELCKDVRCDYTKILIAERHLNSYCVDMAIPQVRLRIQTEINKMAAKLRQKKYDENFNKTHMNQIWGKLKAPNGLAEKINYCVSCGNEEHK